MSLNDFQKASQRPGLRKTLKVGLYLSVAIISIFIGQQFVSSASFDWDFTNAAQFTLSDANKVEVTAGLGRLNDNTGFVDDTAGEFNLGTYNAAGSGESEYVSSNLRIKKLTAATLSDESVLDSQPLTGTDPTPSGLYHMDEDSGTATVADSAGTAENCTSSSTTNVAAGPSGFDDARSFDGTQYLDCGNTSAFTASMSLEAWIYPTAVTGVAVRSIIAKGADASAARSYRFYIDTNGNIAFGLGHPSNGNSYNSVTTGATVLSINTWYHVAAVYNQTDMRIYVNGVLDNTPLARTTAVFTTANNMFIGSQTTAANFFSGQIDDAATYSSALSSTQAGNRYSIDRRLVALYHLNNVNTDSSGNAFTLTNTGVTYANTTPINGTFDYYAPFDGTTAMHLDYTTAAAKLAVTDALTLEAWVYPNTIPAEDDYIIHLDGASADASLVLNTGKVAAISTATSPTTLTGSTTLATSAWSHIAAVWNNGTMTLYVNGVRDGKIPYSTAVGTGNATLAIGNNRVPTASTGFNGSIDEVAVSLRERPHQQIIVDAGAYPRAAAYKSGSKNASSPKDWNNFKWTSTLAYGEEAQTTEANTTHIWHLNATTVGTLVDSEGLRNASDSGTRVTFGLFDRARYFDADADQIATAAALSAYASYTITAWVRFATATPDVGGNERVFDVFASDPAVYRDTDGKMHAVADGGAPAITGTTTVKDTLWHHVAVKHTASTLTLYVDGVSQGTGATDNSGSPAAVFYIGDNGAASDNFAGAIDEVVLYNTALSDAAVLDLYKRGRYRIRYLTRSCNDAGCDTETWTGPFPTAGPKSNQIEPTDIGSTMQLLMHFDEVAQYNGTLNEVVDSATTSNATNSGKSLGVRTTTDGLFDQAAMFGGEGDFIRVQDSANLEPDEATLDLSIEAWLKMDEAQRDGATIVSKQYVAGDATKGRNSYSLHITSGQGLKLRIADATTEGVVTSATTTDDQGVVPVGEWVHVVAVFTGANYNFYINGKDAGNGALSKDIQYDTGHLYIGKDNSAAAQPSYKGLIDALAIYSEIIDATEAATNFDKGNPYNYDTVSGGQDPGIPNNQYGQYRTFLFSDGSDTPLIQTVTMINNTYATDNPTIDAAASTGLAYTGAIPLDSFTLTPGAVTTGSVKFALACTGASCTDTGWKYYNTTVAPPASSGWQASLGIATANTAAEWTSARLALFDDAVGQDKAIWRAYFVSTTGEEQYEIENIQLATSGGGGGETITTNKPDGAKKWLVETSTFEDLTTVIIEWVRAGGATTSTVNIIFDRDGDFLAEASPNNNVSVATGISVTNDPGGPGAGDCDPPAGGGCFKWAAGPDKDRLSTTAKIRVESVENVGVKGDSAAFEVKGWYDVTAPILNQVVMKGTTPTISWVTHGAGMGNVDLEYKIDVGAWTSIAGYQNQPDTDDDLTHSYVWTAVDASCATLSTTGGGGCDKMLVRVKQTGVGTITDSSPNFTIKPRITAITWNNDADSGAPNNFKIGDTSRSATWTLDGTFNGNIEIFYSADQNWAGACSGGAGKCSVCSAVYSAGGCSWAAVPTITPDWSVAFRAEALSDPAAPKDQMFTTPADKAIHGKWSFTAPAANSENFPEEAMGVTWTENTAATLNNVNLWYRVASGAWTLLNSGGAMTEGESGNYNGAGLNDNGTVGPPAGWTIPATFIHDNIQLRVADSNDTGCPSGNCYSGGTVVIKSVLKPRLINPTGVTWKVGEKQDIRWGYKGDTATATNIAIKYCLDGTITCGSPTTLVASVAANNAPADCTVPSGGELNTDEAGGCIEWDEVIDATTTGVGNIKDLEARLFIQDANNQACSPSACAGVRPVIATSNVYIGSAANVKLIPRLAFVGIAAHSAGAKPPASPAPTDATHLDADRDYKLQWDSQGTPLANVNLWYATDGVTFTNPIPDTQSPAGANPDPNTTAATPPASPNNDYTYWRTPSTSAAITLTTPSLEYTVKVEDSDAAFDQDVFVTSPSPYKVVAWFDNLRDGADVALSATTYCKMLGSCTVKWDSHPTDIASVKVQYSLNGGGAWADASGTIANSGTYTWTVNNIADIIGNDTKVRVVDMVANHVQRTNAIPSANFNVVANITVTTPPLGAGVHWRETQLRTIHWKMTGEQDPVSFVKIEYSKDNAADGSNPFDAPVTIIASTANNSDTDDDAGIPGVDTCVKNAAGANETTGCYVWWIQDIADFPDPTVHIRVSDADAGAPNSTQISNNGVTTSAFAVEVIEAVTTVDVEMVAPETSLIPAKNMDIKWKVTGDLLTAGKFVHAYYTTNGSSFTQFTENGPDYDADTATASCVLTTGPNQPYTGCVRLKTPDAISSTFQVRVQDKDDADIKLLSGNKTVDGKVEFDSLSGTVPVGDSNTYVVGNNLTIKWITYGSIGASNDTAIDIDTQYAGSNYLAPGNTQITAVGQNNNNGQGCAPPTATAPAYGGCWIYSLPDTTFSNADMKVRVKDGAWENYSATSTLTGELTLTKPVGSDVWKVETDKKIDGTTLIYVEWTRKGTTGVLGTLKLYLDDDGTFSGGQRLIAAGIAADNDPGGPGAGACDAPAGGGCYVLSGAELPTATEITESLVTGKFRLLADVTPTPAIDSQKSSTATPAFEIRGWYSMVEPAGATLWFTGEVGRYIRWETHGTGMGNVDIQYKLGTGGWANLANGGNIADIDSGAGSATNQLEWDPTGSGVANWSPCPTTTLALGCDKVKVRVKQTGAGTYESQSAADFKIKPRVIITTPAAADRDFQIDASRAIAWTLAGTVTGNVNLYYSKDQAWGSACSNGNGKCSACSGLSGDLTCNWTVTNFPSQAVIFRAEAADDSQGDVYSVTSANSRIHGRFTLSAPSCTGSNCFAEQQDNGTNISWTMLAGTTASIPNVVIQYTPDNGSNWYAVNSMTSITNDLLYDSSDPTPLGPWKTPQNYVTDRYKLRIYDSTDTASLDSASETALFAVKAKFEILTPNGNANPALTDSWGIGDATKDIQWRFLGPTTGMNVNVKFCQDGTIGCGSPGSIASNIAATYSTGCTLPGVSGDWSAGCFRWNDATTAGVANNRDIDVRVFVQDNETDCAPAGCTAARPKLNDGSDNDIKIMVNLKTTTTNPAPTGAGTDEIDANTLHYVRWNSQGTVLANVDIALSSNGGGAFSNIFTAEPNTTVAGSSTANESDTQWTSPLLVTDTSINRTYVIRVKDPNDVAATGYPNAYADKSVKVVAKFNITDPEATDVLTVGQLFPVVSSKLGSLINARYEYYTIDRGSWSPIVQDGSAGTSITDSTGERAYLSTFQWKVPDVTGMISSDVRVRIYDGDDTHTVRTNKDETGIFKVVAGLTMLEPSGDESGADAMKAGYTFNIQWKSFGTNAGPSTVDLEYSKVGDFTDAVSIAPNLANGSNASTWGSCTLPSVSAGETPGCYLWKVHANAIDPSVKFRVKDSDAGAPDSTQVSGNGVTPNFSEIVKATKILNPNGGGGQQLTNGSVYQVQWETYGSFTAGTFDIEYGTDAELALAIPSNPPTDVILNRDPDASAGCTLPGVPDQGGNRGCYAWTVPNDLRTNLRLRIYEDASPNKQDSSDGVFEIVGPLALVTPNGGSFYKVNDTLVIQWSNNILLTRETPVDLEYSTNDFSGACVAATGAGACQVTNSAETPVTAEGLDNNDGSIHYNAVSGKWEYDWKIPDTISDTVKVRVIKQNTPTTGDASNTNFKIVGALTPLNSPASPNEVWYIGSSPAVNIQWVRTGTAQGSLFDDFQIDYCTASDCSGSPISIDANVTLAEAACTGADTTCDYSWVPDAPTHSTNISSAAVYYLRVMDVTQTDAKIISTNQFELAGKTTLTVLGSDDTAKVGTQYNINWTKAGNQKLTHFDNFKIEIDDSSLFDSIDKIIDADVTFAEASCNADDTCTYAWTPDAAAYSTLMTVSPTYYLRVYDPDNLDTKSQSNPNRLELRGDIVLSTLVGGGDQIIKMGQNPGFTINWTKNGDAKTNVFDSFDIQYSSDINFASSTTIATLTFAAASCDTDNSCTYSWIPAAATHSVNISSAADYYLRVLEVQNTDTQSKSTNLFELRGDITLDALPGTRNYALGAGPIFTWTKAGNSQTPNFDNFTLEFSTASDFSSNVTPIATVTFAAAGCGADDTCLYDWASTFTAANFGTKISGTQTYYLRVLDSTNPDTVSSSANFGVGLRQFKIMGRIALDVLPQQGSPLSELYKVNTPVTFTWSREGNNTLTYFDSFTLQYSTSNTFASIAGSMGPINFTVAQCDADNSCLYQWTPGDTDVIVPNKDYYLRVMDADDTDTASTSVGFAAPKFELAGDLDLTILDGADETYTVGTYASGNGKRITFNKRGINNGSVFDNVDLQYSTDVNFATSTPIATVIVNGVGNICGGGNSCTYDWDIPTTAVLTSTADYYLRVVDPNNSDSVNKSTFKFKLRGGFSGLSPLAADKWPVGQDQTFGWTTNGAMSNVKISFSPLGTFADEKFFKVLATKLVYDSAATNFATAANIANTPNGASSYTVTAPDFISANQAFKIRVYDASDSNIFLNSTAFTVHGTTSLGALPGNQIYAIGNTTTFTWNRVGSEVVTYFDNFALQFSTDNTFATGVTTIATLTFADGTGANCAGVDTACFYNWVPDAATYSSKIIPNKDYYLRVLDTYEANTASTSGATKFKIIGRLILNALPQQGSPLSELYKVNTPVTFTWTREGNSTLTYFDSFTLQYSTSSTFASIAGSMGPVNFTVAQCDADLSCLYQWTPGDTDIIAPNKDYYLRVMDADDPDTASTTVAHAAPRFELAGDLNFTILGSNEEYTVGTYASGKGKRIQFNKYGVNNGSTFDNVTIEYSTDANFVTPAGTLIASPVINGAGTICVGALCTFDWDIPTTAVLTSTADYYMRVIDPNNADSVDSSSPSKFKLRGGFSALTPIATDKWPVGQDQTFGWTTNGAMSNVRISFSPLGTFADEKWLKVSATKLVYDSVPTGHSTAQNITNTPNGVSSYTITAPDFISATQAFKIRVYDANDANIYLDTVGFTVHGTTSIGALPTDIYTIDNATPYTLTWTRTGSEVATYFDKFRLQFSTDSTFATARTNMNTTALTFAAANCSGADTSCSYSWTPDAATFASKISTTKVNYMRVIEDTEETSTNTVANTESASGTLFKIVAKITVLTPNAEQNPFWKVGDIDKTITWSTSPATLPGGNQVKLYYKTPSDADWVLIGGAATSNVDGQEAWEPVNGLPDKMNLANTRIKIEDNNDTDASDQSDSPFSMAGSLSAITLMAADGSTPTTELFVHASTPASLDIKHKIQWTSKGTAMNRVLLQYSNDSFVADIRPITTITNNAVGTNSYNWPVPDTIASNWKIRAINDTAGTAGRYLDATPPPLIESTTGTNHKILSRFVFTSHNTTSDKCLLGVQCTINWVYSGTANNIELMYATNGNDPTANWAIVDAGSGNAVNNSTYQWTFSTGLTPTTNVYYRLKDMHAGHPTPAAANLEITDANSKIVAAFPSSEIKLNNDLGTVISGQTFAYGDIITVYYEYTGVVTNIQAQISLDNFVAAPTDITPFISTTATGGGGSGTFSYQFTDFMTAGGNTTGMKLRILDNAVPDTVGNTTNGVTGAFKEKGILTVSNPNAGTERWVVGESATVSWTESGSITSVRVEYDDNATFLSPSNIAACTAAASVANVGGSCNFTVNVANLPDLDSSPLYYKTLYVRVNDVQGEGGGAAIHGASLDASNNAHKVVGKLSLIEASSVPQAGAKWPVGGPQTITWTTWGKVPSVDVYYVPDGTFNGDEVLITTGTCASPVTNTQGANTASANTSCSWTPPVNLALTSTYQIRILDRGDNTTTAAATWKLSTDTAAGSTSGAIPIIGADRDTGAFKIHGFIDNPILTSGSPSSTTKHKASDSATITWDTTGDNVSTVDIQYRDGSGTYNSGNWIDIAGGGQAVHDNTGINKGTRAWTIPITFNSTDLEVRVKPADGTTDGFDLADTLKIMPKITVSAPTNGSILNISQNYNITWDIRGVIPSIGIRYKTTGTALLNDYPVGGVYEIYTAASPLAFGANYEQHNDSAANKNKYIWNVSDTPSTLGRMMIYDPADPADVYGISGNNTGNFELRGFFTVNNYVYNTQTLGADAEFEVYHATNNPNAVTINWNWGGTIPNVIIEYSNTYDGADPATFTAGKKCLDKTTVFPCATVPNGAGSTGSFSYNWQVPDDISRNSSPFYLKITDPGNSNVFDIFPDGASNGFKIKSKFNVTSPDGAESWLVGNISYNITWNWTGTVSNVVLEYSAANNFTDEDLNTNNVLDTGEDLNGNGFLDRILCVSGGTYPTCNAVGNDGIYNGSGSEGGTNGPWKIADDGKLVPWTCNTMPDSVLGDTNHPCKVQTVRLRVRDSGDLAVSDKSAANFTARYVSKVWFLQNAVTGADLNSITMYENSIHKIRAYSSQNVPGIVSPYTLWSPAGTNYTIAFSKVGFTDYFDAGQASSTIDKMDPARAEYTTFNSTYPTNAAYVTTNHLMLDEAEVVYLGDIVAHNDVINQECSYNDTADSLNCSIWYSRDGLNVTTSTSAQFLLYDGGTTVRDSTSNVQNPVGSGVFTFTFASVSTTAPTILKDKDYQLRSKVNLASGAPLQGYKVLNITSSKEAQDTYDNVTTITPIITTNLDGKVSDVISTVNSTKTSLEGTLNATKTSLEGSMNTLKTDVTNILNTKIGVDPLGKTLFTKMDEQTTTINTAITNFTNLSEDAIAEMNDQTARNSIRIIGPEASKPGSKEKFRVSTKENLPIKPTLEFFCPDGTLITKIDTTESLTQAGIYEAEVEFNRDFRCAVVKAATIIATAMIPSENPDNAAFEAIAVSAVALFNADLDTIQGLAAAAASSANSEKASKDAKEAINKVVKMLATSDSNVLMAIGDLQKKINNLPTLLGSQQEGVTQMRSTLDEVSNKLYSFMGNEGYDMRTILKQEIGEGMKGVRNKVDRTLAATEVVRDIVERKVGRSDEPIIQQFYELG